MTDMAQRGLGIELVGRRRELAALTSALELAATGHPSGVLLSGDAGVGKSRLIAEAVGRAAATGFTVAVGRCLDTAESALPYLPFTEIIGGLTGGRPELVEARPALRHLLPGQQPRGEQAAEDRGLGQVRVFDAVLSTLDELASVAPVLVVVEDLHWADRSSRDLLVFLLSRLAGRRLVVLASYRADDLHRRHPLRPVLAELVRLPTVERIELAPLDPSDTLALVRRLADGKLAERSLQQAARRSEGNAFFAEELVSAGSDGLPHELAELLVARIEALAPNVQRMLRIASVAGRRVRHDQLAAVSGMDTDELEQALREAAAHHVLVAAGDPVGGGSVGGGTGTGGDGYAFRHALLREAVYHELLPGERSRIHAAYAALLAGSDRAPPDVDQPGRAAELAHHALAGHDLPLALAASVRAAGEADAREAPAELLVHAERALELWRAVPDAEGVAGIDEGTVTRWAAWGASSTGDPDRGAALGRRALDLAEQRGDPRQRSSMLRSYALQLLDLGGREQEALESARLALQLSADDPASSRLAWAHAALARVLCRLDRIDEAAAEATTAVAVAAAGPAADRSAAGATADALISLAVCAEHGGQPAQARQRLAETTELAQRSGHLGVELRAYFAIGMSLLDEGRLRAAGDQFAVGTRRAAATGATWSGFGLDLRVALVVARFLGGDWDDAESAAELAGESVSASVAIRLAAAGLLVAAGRGRFDSVRRRLSELNDTPIADDQVIMFVGQADTEAALWQGQPAAAARAAQDAITGLSGGAFAGAAPHLGGIMLAALGVTAQADLAAAGERSTAEAAAAGRALLDVAERAAADGLPRGDSFGPEGRAWLSRARAELTRITGPDDPQAWSAVIEAFDYETTAPAAPGEPQSGEPTPGDPAHGEPTPGGQTSGELTRQVPSLGQPARDGAAPSTSRTEPAGVPDSAAAQSTGPPCGYRQAYARLRRAEARLATATNRADARPTRLAEDDLRIAYRAADRLRARPLAAAVQALADRAGIGLEPGPGPDAGGRAPRPGPLTPREHSVLALVAGGRTNRQVGSELFISEKTVSVHLSRVMAKLGATSRTEAVTVAYARGLLTPQAPPQRPATMGAESHDRVTQSNT
jgi:DNA-binding CsgD family transcriptional regulator/tetratricopeptide (TPR) repeat protein